MASSGADRVVSLPQKEYGSCMAMTQPVLRHLSGATATRRFCGGCEAQMFLLMLGSLYVVGDISVVTSRWQVFSALYGVSRASVVKTQS